MVTKNFSKFSWIFMLDTINALSWFAMDVSWMQEQKVLSIIFGVALLITGIASFVLRPINFDRTAVLSWMFMNFFWMLNKMEYAIICAFVGGILLTLSLLTKHNIINFKRKQND